MREARKFDIIKLSFGDPILLFQLKVGDCDPLGKSKMEDNGIMMTDVQT